MKLDCPRKELFEAVSTANAAASGRTPNPFLLNLKLEVDDTTQTLRVLGCDGEMWVERTVPCLVTEPGSICVQARLLVDILSSLPDGDIQLFLVDAQGLMLKQGASEYRLVTLDASDFPEAPDYGGEAELTLPMKTMREAVDSVLFAVSTDTHRPILTGVFFNYDGAALTLVATDTHRLAVRKIEQDGFGSEVNAVLPDKALKVIKALPLGDNDPVTIHFGSGRMGVACAGTRVVSQLLAGVYPPWQRVVPAETTRMWSVEVDQMVEKVKRTMIYARDNANRVRFAGVGNEIVLSARSEEKGEAKEEVPMVATGGDVDIAFNGKYVLDALEAIPGAGVRVEMTEGSKQAIFRPADDGDAYFCVIMPMALN
jgi:DNA polymerase-3 subunit beta